MKDLTNVDVSRLKEWYRGADQISVDDDFCVLEVKGEAGNGDVSFPFRFDGLMLIWCVKGGLKVSVNLNEYEVTEDMLFLCMPGNIFRVESVGGEDAQVQYVVMAMSKGFASDGERNAAIGFPKAISLLDDPRMKLTQAESRILGEHLAIMGNVAGSDLPYRKGSVSALWGSMLQVLSGVLDRREDVRDSEYGGSGRSRQLLEQFLGLVAQYHDRYRNVGFYADKLCLTPKYLSKLIKNTTGRSAPEWIDSFVILEARNLLKYSDCSIKEIVFKLNFPNQSVFYKFFKARTGMTPTEYRKS